MEGFSLFLAIVFIVFGVLQIILFFKIWAMTDDVKKIGEKIGSSNSLKMARLEYLKGNTNKVKEILDDALYDQILSLASNVNNSENPDKEYSKRIIELKSTQEVLYSKMGAEMPNIDRYKDRSNLPI